MEKTSSLRKLISKCPTQETLAYHEYENARSSSLNHHHIRPLSPLDPRKSL